MDELDYSTLTPGIRRTVRLLRDHGFETTDSGDGITNVAAGMEGAMDTPMVACRADPEDLLEESRRLLRLVGDHSDPMVWFNRTALYERVRVEASYSPNDNLAVLVLLGFDDSFLRASEELG